jgi:hypothetical protein
VLGEKKLSVMDNWGMFNCMNDGMNFLWLEDKEVFLLTARMPFEFANDVMNTSFPINYDPG